MLKIDQDKLQQLAHRYKLRLLVYYGSYARQIDYDPSKSDIDIAELNIIPTDFALKIAPSTGLRNILVHEYEDINDEIVYRSIGTCLQYYLEYIDLINQYLKCTK